MAWPHRKGQVQSLASAGYSKAICASVGPDHELRPGVGDLDETAKPNRDGRTRRIGDRQPS